MRYKFVVCVLDDPNVYHFFKRIVGIYIHFTVIPRITPFAFDGGPAETGQYQTLTCTVQAGDFPLNFTWLLNGIELTDSFDISISTVGKRSTFLTIESVQAIHAGTYTCQVQNKAGISQYSTELKVNG